MITMDANTMFEQFKLSISTITDEEVNRLQEIYDKEEGLFDLPEGIELEISTSESKETVLQENDVIDELLNEEIKNIISDTGKISEIKYSGEDDNNNADNNFTMSENEIGWACAA